MADYAPQAGDGDVAEADVYADYEEGLEAALAGDYVTAFREFSVAAEVGLDVAQYNLGILYYTGRGVERDVGLSFRWTLAAAEQGHVGAQSNLGSLYLNGEGVDEDVEQGLAWLVRAARGGDGDAAFSLANFYNEGRVVSRDRVRAHAWAAQAEYNGHPQAAELLPHIEVRLQPNEVGDAVRLFARWQRGEF
ncbi:MAG: tetratricopeptide repeat protein [Pseudohongiellaceae bacterium]